MIKRQGAASQTTRKRKYLHCGGWPSLLGPPRPANAAGGSGKVGPPRANPGGPSRGAPRPTNPGGPPVPVPLHPSSCFPQRSPSSRPCPQKLRPSVLMRITNSSFRKGWSKQRQNRGPDILRHASQSRDKIEVLLTAACYPMLAHHVEKA